MPAKIASRHRRMGLDLPVSVAGRDVVGAPFTEETHTVNVSGGGLCFESRRNLPMGSRLALKIALPPKLRPKFGGRSVYRVRAVVCRVEKAPEGGSFRVGVRFVGETP